MADNNLQGVLLGIGNPLLDISAEVPASLFEKYGVKGGNAILAEEKHIPLYDELVKNYKVDYIAGGAAQNSIRATQWMLQVAGATKYIGSIGNDENGKIIKEAAEKDGVTTLYYIDPTSPTGVCAVLVEKGGERSLVTDLKAANNYKKSHFDSEEIQKHVQQAKFFYHTGFFLTVSPDTLVALGQHAVQHNKQLLMNLSAPFLIDFFWDPMQRVLPYADVIFSNESEALTLGKKLNWGENLEEIARKLGEWEKENKNRKRTVIFTQGSKSTICYHDGKVTTYSPIPCDPKEIVDVNGAGDSFVGGFLSGYVQNMNIEECISRGHYCAWECIRRSGCTFPAKPSYKSQ